MKWEEKGFLPMIVDCFVSLSPRRNDTRKHVDIDDEIMPMTEPIAGLIPSESVFPEIYSPINAPRKAPTINPKGPILQMLQS